MSLERGGGGGGGGEHTVTFTWLRWRPQGAGCRESDSHIL